MGKAVVYELTNIKSGEKFVGTADDISARFGVGRAYISKQWSEGGRIRLDWKVEKLDKSSTGEKPNNGSIPYQLQEEWDRVTAPFKKMYAKKASMA
jgi:hypothetical protein